VEFKVKKTIKFEKIFKAFWCVVSSSHAPPSLQAENSFENSLGALTLGALTLSDAVVTPPSQRQEAN
jgi:hypothetical protein